MFMRGGPNGLTSPVVIEGSKELGKEAKANLSAAATCLAFSFFFLSFLDLPSFFFFSLLLVLLQLLLRKLPVPVVTPTLLEPVTLLPDVCCCCC